MLIDEKNSNLISIIKTYIEDYINDNNIKNIRFDNKIYLDDLYIKSLYMNDQDIMFNTTNGHFNLEDNVFELELVNNILDALERGDYYEID